MKTNDIADMTELMTAIARVSSYGPEVPQSPMLELTFGYEFEPHGRASETWEQIWRLKLLDIPHHWRNNRGEWIRGTTNAPITFTGRTVSEAVARGVNFLAQASDMLIAARAEGKVT